MSETKIDWDAIELRNWLGAKSYNTKRLYKKAFETYVKFTGMTAKQLIDEAEEDEKKPRRQRGIVRRRILEFHKWLREEYEIKSRGKGEQRVLRKGISQKYAHTCVGVIMSFYRANNYPVTLQRGDIPSPVPMVTRKTLDRTDIKKLLDEVKGARNKAIIMMMYQSGMDVSTLCSLNYGDIKERFEKGEVPLLLNLVRKKANFRYRTFIGEDTITFLNIYLNERGEIGFKDPLFVISTKDKEPKRITPNLIQQMMKRGALKAGLVTQEELDNLPINPVSPHALRESFSRTATGLGINKDIIDYFLGHKTPYSGVYSDQPDETLKEKYMLLEPHLSPTKRSAYDRVRVMDLMKMAKEAGMTDQDIIDYFTKVKGMYVIRTEDTHAMVERSDPELLREAIIWFIRKKADESERKKSDCHNGNCQRIINENKLQDYLNDGWRFVATLNHAKCVVER